MPVVSATRFIDIVSKSKDPKKDILSLIGDISGFKVKWNRILVATYIRPNVTPGGIIKPDTNVAEDEWQGKVGLVLKKGPFAYVDDDETQFHGESVEVGDWALYKVGNAWSFNLHGYPCRMIRDSSIEATLDDPSIVF